MGEGQENAGRKSGFAASGGQKIVVALEGVRQEGGR